MNRALILLAAPLALAASGCVTDGYYGGDLAYGPVTYDGWYDGYYGPIYDGYWGNNGYFYYRSGVGDRRFRRGDHAHFHRGPDAPSGGSFQPMHGSFQPSRGMHTPGFSGGHHRR